MILNFKHQYHKLADAEFTTVRGKSHFRSGAGGFATIKSPKDTFIVEIVSLQLHKVEDLSLEMMIKDAGYPGFEIKSMTDFIGLLNSFRHPFAPQVRPDSIVCVITLRRL